MGQISLLLAPTRLGRNWSFEEEKGCSEMKSKWVEQLIVTNAPLISHRHRALLAPCCPCPKLMSMPPVAIENFHLSRYRSLPLAKPSFCST